MVTNLINGKKYVGQTRRGEQDRWAEHIYSAKYGSTPLASAIRGFCPENFKIETLCVCSSQQELNEKEIGFIEGFNTRDPEIGYNVQPGGGAVGPISQEEVRRREDERIMLRDQTFTSLAYIVAWAGAPKQSVQERKFLTLQEASVYAKIKKDEPSIRIEEVLCVTKIKKIPKERWIL